MLYLCTDYYLIVGFCDGDTAPPTADITFKKFQQGMTTQGKGLSASPHQQHDIQNKKAVLQRTYSTF